LDRHFVENIKTRSDFIAFLKVLEQDLKHNRDDWENPDLERFLEAMSAWMTDTGGKGSADPSWALFASALLAAKIYV
jgi:hypothetical protein